MNEGQWRGIEIAVLGLAVVVSVLAARSLWGVSAILVIVGLIGAVMFLSGCYYFGRRTTKPPRNGSDEHESHRRQRWRERRKAGLVIYAVIGLIIAGAWIHPVASGSGAHPMSLSSNSSVQQTSTASITYQRGQTFYQNGSATYNDGSTIVSFPATLGVPGNVAVSTFSATFAILIGTLSPRVNVSQGTATLANVSAPYTFTLTNPIAGATPIKERIVAAFTPAGATPSIATYVGTANCTEAITFTKTTTLTWGLNQGNYSANYTLTAPAGMALNGTVIYVPFPANASVNYTSVKVYLANALVPQIQVASGGIYITVNGVAAGQSQTFAVSFHQPPELTGPAPYLPIHYYYQWSGAQYAFNVSWINLAPIPYGGQYLIIVSGFPYPMDPANLVVSENGKVIPNGSYQLVGGNTLDILPGVVTVYTGSIAVFLVKFYFLGAPPSLSFVDTAVVFSVGPSPVTVGELLVVGIGIVVVYTAVEYLGFALGRGGRIARGDLFPRISLEQRRTFAGLGGLLFVLILALYVGTL